MKKILSCMAAIIFFSTVAMAETDFFNISLTPNVAVYPRSDMIEGLTLSVWGENEQKALALGLVNGSVGHSWGLNLGILNYADSYKGPQFGLVNYTKHDSTGFQIGFLFGLLISAVNYTGDNMTGLYTSVFNCAGNLTGVELGFVNYADDAKGVQIGIINIIHRNSSWFSDLPNELAPAMILVNWRF